MASSIVLVELTAVALVVTGLVNSPLPGAGTLFHLAVLCGFGLVHAEIAIGVERVRQRVTAGNHVDLSSVWTFAAAIVLPPSVAAFVAVVLQTHLWLRVGRPRVALYRNVFSTATIVLACVAASNVVTSVNGPTGRMPTDATDLAGYGLALLVYTTVNTGLVAGAIAISTPQPDLTRVFGQWDDSMLEIATLSVGALAAVALAVNPWLVLFVLPPILVLHRAVLVRHLEEAASIDGKTGLLNAAAWHTRAERVLRRGGSDDPRGVLVVDLDHFKAVNDTFGHLAGDQVLVAVAGALRAEVRERDLVGRFGGEEFVVLLAGLGVAGPAELTTVAERIRRRVADLRVEVPTPDGPLSVTDLSVSIGGAVSPEDGGDLRDLLQIADTALYAAKRSGRNAVRMGTAHAPQLPSSMSEPPTAAG
ncbi:sensor domain-containing diguanylate cyclase [Pseudonocardia nigra]|uniref:sensor domain-containing diguanylate cyclase n=1 Tax=Pseudonocardia nigra TaxID=1921578 RepID=UPI001C5E8235|nr:GGDEF domain-containing protein [Pseudonocardia nigra]